jgi:DNA-binding NarL/FixJ family response regulator
MGLAFGRAKNKEDNDEHEFAVSSDSADDKRWQDPNFVKRNAHWVVLVEDEQAIRQSVGDYLYDSGFQVSACDSAQAFQTLILQQLDAADTKAQSRAPKSTRKKSSIPAPHPPAIVPGRLPDVVVSDIRMPAMDGIELLEWIRAHPSTRLSQMPVVLLTAKGLTADRIAGYRSGADFYLTKPFAPEELLGILDNCILRRGQEQQRQLKLAAKNDVGVLADMQRELAEIKAVLQQNAASTVLKTSVFLTPAEREVIQLLGRGYTNAEIASVRGVAVDRIVRILQKLYASTGTKSRTELVRWAIKTGYVPKR